MKNNPRSTMNLIRLRYGVVAALTLCLILVGGAYRLKTMEAGRLRQDLQKAIIDRDALQQRLLDYEASEALKRQMVDIPDSPCGLVVDPQIQQKIIEEAGELPNPPLQRRFQNCE